MISDRLTEDYVLTESERGVFLDSLFKTRSVSDAIRACGRSRRDVYKSRSASSSFEQDWDETTKLLIDDLEGTALRHATEGWAEPVYYKGAFSHWKRVYSPPLMMFMLKALKSERYAENMESKSAEEFARELQGVTTRMRETFSSPN